MDILDNPRIWQFSRKILDKIFGLYSVRLETIAKHKLITKNNSVLDIGCGTGHYSAIPASKYLGVDLNNKYIEYAKSRYGSQNKTFRCVDATTIGKENNNFDIVLIVDFIHHLSDKDAIHLLSKVKNMANKYLINFEPLREESPHIIDRFLMSLDRGKYIRTLPQLKIVYKKSGLQIYRIIKISMGIFKSYLIITKPVKHVNNLERE